MWDIIDFGNHIFYPLSDKAFSLSLQNWKGVLSLPDFFMIARKSNCENNIHEKKISWLFILNHFLSLFYLSTYFPHLTGFLIEKNKGYSPISYETRFTYSVHISFPYSHALTWLNSPARISLADMSGEERRRRKKWLGNGNRWFRKYVGRGCVCVIGRVREREKERRWERERERERERREGEKDWGDWRWQSQAA